MAQPPASTLTLCRSDRQRPCVSTPSLSLRAMGRASQFLENCIAALPYVTGPERHDDVALPRVAGGALHGMLGRSDVLHVSMAILAHSLRQRGRGHSFDGFL